MIPADGACGAEAGLGVSSFKVVLEEIKSRILYTKYHLSRGSGGSCSALWTLWPTADAWTGLKNPRF